MATLTINDRKIPELKAYTLAFIKKIFRKTKVTVIVSEVNLKRNKVKKSGVEE